MRLLVWLLLPEPSPCELGVGQRGSTNTPYFCRRIFRGFSLMLRDHGSKNETRGGKYSRVAFLSASVN